MVSGGRGLLESLKVGEPKAGILRPKGKIKYGTGGLFFKNQGILWT
jgi:hypothetical protein